LLTFDILGAHGVYNVLAFAQLPCLHYHRGTYLRSIERFDAIIFDNAGPTLVIVYSVANGALFTREV